MTDQILPKFGLSCYPNERADLSASKELWNSFLQVLISMGIVDEDRKHGVLSWIGNHLEITSIQSSQFFSDSENIDQHILLRTISHIKIIFTPKKPLWTKIYLKADDVILTDELYEK